MNPPEARIISRRGNVVRVECPYCGKPHSHKLIARGSQRFAPRCGMLLNPDDRARGYVFTTN